jgi:Neutral/alkaline non-lysosomal ceramidase, N-terminal
LLARSASCDITPRDRTMRLAGYAARTEPVSTILDPIEISAVLLECGGQRCLIFSFDLMIVGAELQQIIFAKLARHGFKLAEIMLLASHTHFAPATDQACARLGVPEQQFVNDVADAAEGLLLRMLREQASEITLEMRQGRLNHSINRRRHWRFPTFRRTCGLRFESVVMAPNPQGPTDERATVLLLRRADDATIIGVIWHYTCHPTAVIPDDVVSSDYPGVVRRALRERFGEIPCVFAQGFCGDIRPNMRRATPSAGLRGRLRRMARTMVSGPSFAAPAAGEWTRWSEDLAAKVVAIAQDQSGKISSPATLATGSANIPLGGFFKGSVPDKPLAVQVVRFGDMLELVALSAEATVEWHDIIDREMPVRNGRVRLYAGYLGALFGYLPTAVHIPEGGYEVEGFQPLFGLSGKFDSEKIMSCVMGGVKRAFDEIERAAGNNR